MNNSEKIKEFYTSYDDRILDKRYNSPYSLRRYVTREIVESVLRYVEPGEEILDAGCGDGIISVLAAKKGAKVTALDISLPNLERAKKLTKKNGVYNIKFLQGDVENLPFPNNSFDLVISSQVLEHLPDFEKGLSEIKRATKKRAIITLPTCLNLCALSLLGGAEYWYIRKKTPLALLKGILKFILNIFKKGIDEGYTGKKLPHLWRYPWAMKRELKKAGFKIIHFEANSLCLPYFKFFLPVVKFLDRFKKKPILRNFGCGSIAVVEKNKSRSIPNCQRR